MLIKMRRSSLHINKEKSPDRNEVLNYFLFEQLDSISLSFEFDLFPVRKSMFFIIPEKKSIKPQ